MKSIIYKNRIISAIILGFITLLLITYLQSKDANYLIWVAIIPLVAFISRKILGKGTDLSIKEKIILTFSFVIMAGGFMFFTYNMAIYNIINRWFEIFNYNRNNKIGSDKWYREGTKMI